MALGRFAGRPQVLERFRRLIGDGRLAQSYLFAGPEGSGKELTALDLARRVNCPRPEPCPGPEFCESCRKALTFQHPDIHWICPAPAGLKDADVAELLEIKQHDPFYQPAYASSSEVTIGDPDHPSPLSVRALLQFLRRRPFQGRSKVAIVADAHRLRAAGANAFLKTLEEPPADALILLLTSVRSAVLPTIQSRCQIVPFEPYAEDELADLLTALYGEAPDRNAPRAVARLDALTRDEAVALARLAAGDARRAAAMRRPVPRLLSAWARELVADVHAGRGGSLLTAAEILHKGQLPAALADAAGLTAGERGAEGLPERRERAIQLCEMINLHYSEILQCRERAEEWRPRLPEESDAVRGLAARRATRTLLRDIEAVEKARGGVDRNLNIGLTLAVMFQELVRHESEDRTAAGAGA